LSAWEKKGGAVLACSALKESYRATLGSRCGESIRWIFLNASEAVLADRLASRQGHFFDRKLLKSQLIALEIPDYGWLIDVKSSPGEIVKNILERLRGE
jgi:carbohydrate kinase (thermoresistant glucokinase family)